VGTEKMKKPGGGTLVQPQQPVGEFAPGKTTLVESMPKPASAKAVDIPYIVNENAAPEGSNKFLTTHQRDLLTFRCHDNIIAAQNAWGLAWSQAWVENIVQKDEELPVLLTLGIELIAGQAIIGLGAAFKFLQKAPREDVFDILRNEIPAPNAVMEKIRGISDGTMTTAIRAATNTGKKQAMAGLKSESKEKRDDNAYLIEMADRSAFVFEHQRTEPFESITDGDLVLLERAWRAVSGHMASDYKTSIVGHMARYKKSEASKIGRSRRDDLFNARDSKVVWVNHSKRGKRLHYHTLDHTGKGTANIPKDVDMRDETKVSPTQTRTADFQIGAPVEREFEETALEKHLQEWKAPPETLDVDDDLQPTPDAERDAKDLNQFVPQNNEDFQPAGAGMDANDPRTWVPKT